MGIDFRVASGITALSLLCGSSLLAPMDSSAADKKPKAQLVTVDDYFRLAYVDDPRISPDGRWIAYTATTRDLEADESNTRIWMMPAAGGKAIPLSAEGQSSSSPRWSPDGKHLGFLSSRNEGKTQVWTLFREGGEAVKRTDTAQERVVYPDEFHGIDTPSHARDLYERYLVWFGRYLKGEKTAKAH